MSMVAFQIIGISIAFLMVYLGADQIKHESFALMAFVTVGFPSQRASNAENVYIWWRHHKSQHQLCEDLNILCQYSSICSNEEQDLWHHINGLVQGCGKLIGNALEILQAWWCKDPS